MIKILSFALLSSVLSISLAHAAPDFSSMSKIIDEKTADILKFSGDVSSREPAIGKEIAQFATQVRLERKSGILFTNSGLNTSKASTKLLIQRDETDASLSPSFDKIIEDIYEIEDAVINVKLMNIVSVASGQEPVSKTH